MAAQSHCLLCEGHMRELELAQSTLSVLQSEVFELRLRENEAIEREGCAKDKLLASLGREKELLGLIREGNRGSLSRRASLLATQIPEPLKIEGGVMETAVNTPMEPKPQGQVDPQQRQKGSQSCDTHRKRRKLVEAWSEEEDEASPASKKRLFSSCDDVAPLNATLLDEQGQEGGTPESPGSPPESPGRVGVVGMEFGGGITVSELVTKDPEVDGKVTPKPSRRRLRGKNVEFGGPADAPEQPPVKVELRRSKRLSQCPPMPLNEVEDEIEDEDEASDEGSDFCILESPAESSESSKIEAESDDPSKPKGNNSNVFGLSDSDSGSEPPLARRLRSSQHPTSGTQTHEAQSSESLQSRSESDRVSSPVNLLRTSLNDVELDDSDDDPTLSGFIVQDSSSSEESASNSDDQMSDSDSGEKDRERWGTFREDIVRKRQNLVWEFEGDMLVAIETNSDVAAQGVCALYRQQTRDERSAKGALLRNGRGFDKMNARKGSSYAEFLIDGDESGQLKKSTRALQARFPGALKDCRGIASHHSKQLFEIYSNNEDLFWRKPAD